MRSLPLLPSPETSDSRNSRVQTRSDSTDEAVSCETWGVIATIKPAVQMQMQMQMGSSNSDVLSSGDNRRKVKALG